jgi:anthranilate phosphoribosyltransferase
MDRLVILTSRLAAGHELAAADIAAAAGALIDPGIAVEAKAAFLTALADKGETVHEVAGFALAFRAMAVDPGVERWAPQAIDVVGTGGDHAGGFNISSLVVLTLASLGVKVMKHGNRGITSKCGSADLLAGLGLDLQAPREKMQRAMDELGYVFFFAPAYHPVFQHISPARKILAAQGRRSIFNLLGPLINPGRPEQALIGVFDEEWVPKLAGAHELMGTRAGLVAHGIIAENRGIDELTSATENRVRGFGRLGQIDGKWRPEDFGLARAPFEDLVGGDLAANLATVEAILAGRGPPGLVDTIVMNAAVALWIMERTSDLKAGLGLAREHLLGGAVREKIAATRKFYRS